jgi:REP element-mobilizing transposase RayT
VSEERHLMEQPPYRMDAQRRQAVLASIVDRCSQQNWILLAAHVRTNHVHLVVEGAAPPERIVSDLKSYVSLPEPDQTRRTRSKTVGATWKHTVVVGTGECVGSHPLCG